MARGRKPAGRSLPAYCEHKGTGQAFVRITIDGKRQMVYLGKYNSRESLAMYDKTISDWLASRPIERKSTFLTVRDVAERYKSYQEPLLNSDKFGNVRVVMNLIGELFGDRPADEFDAMLFDRFKAELVKREYSRAYGNRLIAITKAAFKYAMQRRLIPPEQFILIDSVDLLTAKEAPTKTVEPVDDAIVDLTLPHLSNDFADMVRFIRATGCRPGEARLMRVRDIDRQNWLLTLPQHKTASKGKVRIVPIPAVVREHFVHESLTPRLLKPASGFVFSPDGDGKRSYQKRSLGQAIMRVCEDNEDIPHWHAYQLRHTRATEVRAMYGVEVAQVMLGHTRIDMTQHYAGVTKEKVVEVGKLLG